ncbi:histone-lysine N-methyltransferase EZ3 [Selaginella moellendorffii]|uniref:histone-lysine N-methyltransferase EZ3 n=1 Tax=Selaginella moellendorffii TaxID=88036 RepID=UPI000D1CD0C0|nr:histone-lysine N-methyltransferase EZ3 [Selaginella moellendorffii]|eukprot:XP_024540907.1 histone-lysine N-methyltransferase EZ3 [Selaginella moellendorffii]
MQSMEEGEASGKVSMAALSATFTRLKKQVAFERQAYVKARMDANSERLQGFCTHLLALSSSRAVNNRNHADNDMLNTRIQKALNKLGTDPAAADQQCGSQDDSSAPILFNNSGGKSIVKPVRLQTVQKTPPYTTWIFLDRNQRMAEDQSVVGRRRIYYDSAENEALICSDSEEEQVEEEEEKRDFSKGDDFLIRATVQEHGSSKMVFKALADCLDAKPSEIEARYEILAKDGDKLKSEEKHDLLSAMDSFDNLFCRRCLVFDCRLHGCSQPVIIPFDKQTPLNKTGELPSVPCGPCCFHLPRLSSHHDATSSGVESKPVPVESTAPAIEKSWQVPDSKDKGVATEPVAKTVDKPPEAPKKSFKDKSVTALRRLLLKRKATRHTDDDTNEARKKHHVEGSHAEVGDGSGNATRGENTGASMYLKKLVSKKLYAQRKWKGSQITTVKRPPPVIKESEDVMQSISKNLTLYDSNWNTLEKDLYETGLQIFGRDSCLISRNLLRGMKSCAEVGEFMQLEAAVNWKLNEETKLQQDGNTVIEDATEIDRSRSRLYNGRRRGRVRRLKYTWKSVGYPAIRKRLVDGKDGCRQYTPCSCSESCGKQCSCHRNGTCCEKYCGCSKNCKNRFRGCHCAKSQCSSRQCPCFAAGRECDPDVCRNCWIGCGDGSQGGPPARGDSYECRNMKLLLKQQQRVLLGRSDVAGWGAFLKTPVNKHDYLGEYTGELISHREADKRGKIYDRENSSFLFNLNDQYVLDACRKGDKLKFANHSPNPNCYAKVIMVAGDHRVGIFAKERISAGEELFYDYRYEADRAPPWARKPEDGQKNDEAASGSGRAQKTA